MAVGFFLVMLGVLALLLAGLMVFAANPADRTRETDNDTEEFATATLVVGGTGAGLVSVGVFLLAVGAATRRLRKDQDTP